MSYIPSATVAANPSLFPYLSVADSVSPCSKGAAYVSCSTHNPKSNGCNGSDGSGKDAGVLYRHTSSAWSGWRYGGDDPPLSRRQAPNLDTSSLLIPPMETPSLSASVRKDLLSSASNSFIPPPASSPGSAPEGAPSSISSGVLSRSDSVPSSISPGDVPRTESSSMQSNTIPGSTPRPIPVTSSALPRTSVTPPQPPTTSSSISIISRQTPQSNSIPSTAEEPAATLSIFTTVLPSTSIDVTISGTIDILTDIFSSLPTMLSDTFSSVIITFTLSSTSTEYTTSLSQTSSMVTETITSAPSTLTTSPDAPSTSLTTDQIPEANITSTSLLETTTATITTTSWFASAPTSRVPFMTSFTISPSTPLAHISQALSTSTFTKYWTSTYSGSITITHSTLVQTGVLSTDRTRSDDGFERNTGAIIGIAIAGTFVVITSVFVIFFTCRRWKRRGGVVSDSRENFLGQVADPAWRSPLEGDDELDPFHGYRRPPASLIAGGPVYSHPNSGSGGGTGDHERISGNASAESAGMYPIRTHSFGGKIDSNVYTSGYGEGAAGSILSSGPTSGLAPADMGFGRERARSMDAVMARSLGPAPEYGRWSSVSLGIKNSPQAQPLPNQYPYQTTNISDPFQDRFTISPETNPGSMSGHQSSGGNSKSASSLYLGSSSQGHAISNSHTGIGVPTSSSGHGAASARSKSVSPVGRKHVPPSSFVPPRKGQEGDSGSGSDRSSMRGLLGMFKGKGKEKGKSKSTQLGAAAGAGSSAESMSSKKSRSMSLSQSQHGTIFGPASAHGHGPPSSLLNPPMPILALPPQNETPFSESTPPIRYPDISQPPLRIGHAYSTPEELAYSGYYPESRISLGPNVPHIDLWPPPLFPSSPSPVPTDASSMVEGLLNPRMLPGGTSAGHTPGSFLGLGTSEDGGGSVMSLRDNIDYSRPICGVGYKMKSTTTFGTVGVDEGEITGTLSASASTGPDMADGLTSQSRTETGNS